MENKDDLGYTNLSSTKFVSGIVEFMGVYVCVCVNVKNMSLSLHTHTIHIDYGVRVLFVLTKINIEVSYIRGRKKSK